LEQSSDRRDGEPIVADLGEGLGHDALVTVRLTKDYATHHPPGYPFRIAHDEPVVAGTVIDLIKPEADALVAAGAAQYPLDETGPPIPSRRCRRPRGPIVRRTFPNNGGMPDRRRLGDTLPKGLAD